MELYLDANAHIPLNSKAAKVYLDFANSRAGHGHPSSLSTPGREAAVAMETAREKIAHLIGAKNSHQIIFTSSCTQACEWAIEMLLSIDDNKNLCSSPMEHPSVKDVVTKYNSSWMPVNSFGMVQEISDSNKRVCLHLQNEIGTIQNLIKIKGDSYLFSDMSQSLGKIPINVTELDVDLAAFGCHKFGGPGGIGFIYLKNSDWWRPFGSGSRYFMDRTGTPDVAGVVASAAALEDVIDTLSERTQKMIEFQTTLETKLKDHSIEIVGESGVRSPNTSFIYLPRIAMNAILELGQKGFHVGLGSACGSMHAGPSPLMKVLGRQGSVHDYMRISQFGEYGKKEANLFFDALKSVL